MTPLFGFSFSDVALASLGKIPPKFRAQVMKKAKALMQNPRPPGVKRLKNNTTSNGFQIYRERSGDYRILYVVRENPEQVVILDIGHRKDVYR